MQLESGVRELADHMRDLAEASPPRTVSFLLGDGCAEAAGVPTTEVMARRTAKRLGAREGGGRVTPPPDDADDTVLDEWFTNYLHGLGPTQRYKVIEPYYRQVLIPSFYRDIADLVGAGFITHVLTTNVDSLLEQALDRAGLRVGIDYQVIVLGSDAPRSTGDSGARLQVVKLHGDLGAVRLPVAEEIDQVLESSTWAFRSQLLDELVVVGHDLGADDEPVNEWVWRRTSTPLWWAVPEDTADVEALAPQASARELRLVAGPDDGSPEGLFARLSFQLLRLPAMRATGILPSEDTDEQSLEVAFHRGELSKTRAVTRSLREQSVPGIQDDALNTAINNQEKRALHFEAQVAQARRPDDSLTGQVAAVVDRVVREVGSSTGSDPAADYVREQAQLALRYAVSKDTDGKVTRAALAGMVSVIDALEADLSPETSQQLRSMSELVEKQLASEPGPPGESS